MTKQINSVSIIGMGALGLLYARFIQENLGDEAVRFIMNCERFEKLNGKIFKINGQEVSFNLEKDTEAKPADLVIVAVKSTGLESALKTMEKSVGPDTIIISVMNGISSEEIIGAKFGMDKVIYTVAQGMDAMKFGESLNYTKAGELRTGMTTNISRETFDALTDFFERAGIPYIIEENIIRRLWSKFMLNVGINQTCMVYGKTYSQVLTEKEPRQTFVGAMKEVIEISKAENINLNQEDLEMYVKLTGTLSPDGTPSMGQDRINRKKSEVEMFAGTVIKIAEKHGIPVPVNRFLYEQVQKIEAEY